MSHSLSLCMPYQNWIQCLLFYFVYDKFSQAEPSSTNFQLIWNNGYETKEKFLLCMLNLSSLEWPVHDMPYIIFFLPPTKARWAKKFPHLFHSEIIMIFYRCDAYTSGSNKKLYTHKCTVYDRSAKREKILMTGTKFDVDEWRWKFFDIICLLNHSVWVKWGFLSWIPSPLRVVSTVSLILDEINMHTYP